MKFIIMVFFCSVPFILQQPWSNADTITSCQCLFFLFYCCGPFASSHCVQNVCFKFCAIHVHSLHQCLNLYIVTICLKLPDSQLQYFVHSLISTNPSQGIYTGIGATLVNHFYKFLQSHPPHLLKSYTQSWKTSRETKTDAVRLCVHFSASFTTSFLHIV